MKDRGVRSPLRPRSGVSIFFFLTMLTLKWGRRMGHCDDNKIEGIVLEGFGKNVGRSEISRKNPWMRPRVKPRREGYWKGSSGFSTAYTSWTISGMMKEMQRVAQDVTTLLGRLSFIFLSFRGFLTGGP